MWFCSCFTSCKGIQDSVGFRIPRRGFRIPGAGFQSLSVKLGSRIPIVTGILDSLSCFCISKSRVPDFTSKNFPDSFTWGDVLQIGIMMRSMRCFKCLIANYCHNSVFFNLY